MASKKQTRIVGVKEAVSWIEDGMTVGVGEFSYQNPPMALVREIIRQKKKKLSIVSGPTSGLATDFLIGAGCVTKVITAGVAFEGLAGIAPAFRTACEKGKLAVWECDECIWQIGLKAAAYGIPYMLWQGGIGSDIPTLNHAIKIVRVDGEGSETIISNSEFRSPNFEKGELFLKIPAIKPNITFVHAAWADEYGNVQYPRKRFLGRVFNELLLAEATRGRVVASVEKIISNQQVLQQPELTVLREAYVVESPQGAKPGGCNGVYPPDLDGYKTYLREGKI